MSNGTPFTGTMKTLNKQNNELTVNYKNGFMSEIKIDNKLSRTFFRTSEETIISSLTIPEFDLRFSYPQTPFLIKSLNINVLFLNAI